MSNRSIEQVKQFWEDNPLFTGESESEPGSEAFFAEHKQTYVDDCFAGELDARLFPETTSKGFVLDLGCGPGFWACELKNRGAEHVVAADLTDNALELAKRRAAILNLDIEFEQQNAESLNFDDGVFDHVNCQGVIHHTPRTEMAAKEIARVIKKDGTALISVYYRNGFLRLWPVIRPFAYLLYKFGGGLKGRGRESIFAKSDVDEIVRLYDGSDNPIGKSYSTQQFHDLLSPYFIVEETFLHFFPARSLPFPIPRKLHKFLDKHSGFLIFARCKKR